MYRSPARYIFALMALVVIPLLSCGCDITKPFRPDPPAKRFFGGAMYNGKPDNLQLRLANPPSEYADTLSNDINKNYYLKRRFDASDGNGHMGVTSYWLHSKSEADPPYHFEVLSLENNHVAWIDIRPNANVNDAPTPDTQQPGLDWWYVYPNGGNMMRATPASVINRAINQLVPSADDIRRAWEQLMQGGDPNAQ